MADLKISQLNAITVLTPATDVLPVVDSGGVTKKITTNQILGSGGTATLASATISGALTVDTTTLVVNPSGYADRVGIGTATPAEALHVSSGNIRMSINQFLYLYYGSATNYASLGADNSGNVQIFTGLSSPANRFQIANDGVCTWSNVGGVAGTAMTLNATGLGVGYAPSGSADKLGSAATLGVVATGATADLNFRNSSLTAIQRIRYTDGTGVLTIGSATGTSYSVELGGNTTTRAVTIDASSNVGIGVTPITSHILSCAGPVAISGTTAGTRTSYIANASACSIYYTDGGGSGYFTDFGNLIIQPRTSAARSVVIATGSTTPVERAVVKSTGQVRFVPLAADPAGAEAGDVYYNSSSNKLKCYNGTTWNDLF